MASIENVHAAVKPIAWLIGKWRGVNGIGVYPSIKTFSYDEELEFTHPAPHQPVLHVKSTSWLINDEKKRIIAHCEYGFLKVRPATNPPVICYTSTQNTSITTIEEGHYDDAEKTIKLEAKSVCRSQNNPDPSVTKISREIQFKDNKIIMKMCMGTSTNDELAEHLSIELQRVQE